MYHASSRYKTQLTLVLGKFRKNISISSTENKEHKPITQIFDSEIIKNNIEKHKNT